MISANYQDTIMIVDDYEVEERVIHKKNGAERNTPKLRRSGSGSGVFRRSQIRESSLS